MSQKTCDITFLGNNMTFTANIIMLNIKMQKQHDFSAIFCHVIYRK